MRAAIYARFSTDLQNPSSIEDQARLCREWIEKAGGSVAQVYSDAAASGASALRRPGYRALLAAIARHEFDAVLAEALDRFSRNLADTAELYELCKFHGVSLLTLDYGRIGLIHVGMAGTMSAVFLEGLAEKIRRGMRGQAERGLSPGGKTYGYRVGATRGERVIDEREAHIVRRILEDFAAGLSPRSIARALNEEGIAAPRGGQWRASNLIGHRSRANGILHNRLYIGELLFGRQRRAKNPATGRTVMQPRPEHEWRMIAVPGLRIVSDELWEKARARLVQRDHRPVAALRRPPRLLSGLLHCGSCGGKMTIKSNDRYCCGAARETGSCGHRTPIAAPQVEARVVEALRMALARPELEQAFAAEYKAHRARLSARAPEHQADASRRLLAAQRGMAGLMKAIEDGLYTPDMKARMAELAEMRRRAEADLKAIAQVTPVYPRLNDRFRHCLATLGHWLSENSRHAAEAKSLIRDLCARIDIHPWTPERSRPITIHGNLGVIGGSGGPFAPMAPILIAA